MGFLIALGAIGWVIMGVTDALGLVDWGA